MKRTFRPSSTQFLGMTPADARESLKKASHGELSDLLLTLHGDGDLDPGDKKLLPVVNKYRSMKAGPERQKFRKENHKTLKAAGAIR